MLILLRATSFGEWVSFWNTPSLKHSDKSPNWSNGWVAKAASSKNFSGDLQIPTLRLCYLSSRSSPR
eukprot:3489211-Amphidinium_carterae.2